VAKFGLDLERGRELAAMEVYGDWYRDPWGWPEVLSKDFVANLDVEEHLGIDKSSVSTSLDPYFHPMEVPKSYLVVRPAVVQDPVSRLAYIGAVLNGAEDLHSGLAVILVRDTGIEPVSVWERVLQSSSLGLV
jgi:hypothetical protein